MNKWYRLSAKVQKKSTTPLKFVKEIKVCAISAEVGAPGGAAKGASDADDYVATSPAATTQAGRQAEPYIIRWSAFDVRRAHSAGGMSGYASARAFLIASTIEAYSCSER